MLLKNQFYVGNIWNDTPILLAFDWQWTGEIYFAKIGLKYSKYKIPKCGIIFHTNITIGQGILNIKMQPIQTITNNISLNCFATRAKS